MIQRLQFDDWVAAAKVVASILFFILFVWILVRTVAMPRHRVRHMKSLPLADERKQHERRDE